MQKGMRLNDGHITYLALLAKKDGTRRGCLSKKSSDNTKWHSKWFALLQNMLFYFENDSSSRPSGLYLLEGCVCDRAPSPKPSLSAKECLEKQVRYRSLRIGSFLTHWQCQSNKSTEELVVMPQNLFVSLWMRVKVTFTSSTLSTHLLCFISFQHKLCRASNFPEMLLQLQFTWRVVT